MTTKDLRGSPGGMVSRVSPRLSPLPPEQWDDSLKALLEHSPGGLERPLDIFTTLARHPNLFRRWLGFGGALLEGKLEPRQRELVILRTAHNCGSDYEWTQHVPMARAVGVRDGEVESVRKPLEAGGWSDADGALLRAADELHENFGLSDETWARLTRNLDPARCIELVMLVGQYHLVALTISALQIEIETP
ncbi:MAG: carboxymuconolactone decarboxylase family protein [Acidimicrobiales bacterium]